MSCSQCFLLGVDWIYESARGIKECYTSAWQKWMNLLHFCVGVVFQNILVSVIAATQAFWNPKQIFLQSLFHLDDSVNHCLHKKQFEATTKDAIPWNKMLGISDCRITSASVTSSCKKTWRFWRLNCWEENLLSRGVFFKAMLNARKVLLLWRLGHVFFWPCWNNCRGSKLVDMCQGRNSSYFHVIGDGHQPNSRGLYTNYKDSYWRWDWMTIPNIRSLDPGTYGRSFPWISRFLDFFTVCQGDLFRRTDRRTKCQPVEIDQTWQVIRNIAIEICWSPMYKIRLSIG